MGVVIKEAITRDPCTGTIPNLHCVGRCTNIYVLILYRIKYTKMRTSKTRAIQIRSVYCVSGCDTIYSFHKVLLLEETKGCVESLYNFLQLHVNL